MSPRETHDGRGSEVDTKQPSPEPPSGPSLISRVGWALRDRLIGRGDEKRAYDAVKLVHSDDLHKWDRFPRCQEFDGVTYGQYRVEADQVERLRRSVAHLIKARATHDELDTHRGVEYHTELVEGPGRHLQRGTVRLPLHPTQRPGA